LALQRSSPAQAVEGSCRRAARVAWRTSSLSLDRSAVGKVRYRRMMAANGEAREDILTCPKCGGKLMNIYVDENETQRVRCAECRNLVAYTSKLIRIL
jgi:hypothetical protein